MTVASLLAEGCVPPDCRTVEVHPFHPWTWVFAHWHVLAAVPAVVLAVPAAMMFVFLSLDAARWSKRAARRNIGVTRTEDRSVVAERQRFADAA